MVAIEGNVQMAFRPGNLRISFAVQEILWSSKSRLVMTTMCSTILYYTVEVISWYSYFPMNKSDRDEWVHTPAWD